MNNTLLDFQIIRKPNPIITTIIFRLIVKLTREMPNCRTLGLRLKSFEWLIGKYWIKGNRMDTIEETEIKYEKIKMVSVVLSHLWMICRISSKTMFTLLVHEIRFVIIETWNLFVKQKGELASFSTCHA